MRKKIAAVVVAAIAAAALASPVLAGHGGKSGSTIIARD
jgi:hypothetical protein